MNEAPPLAGVIGHPIGQSKSPILHGHWLNRYGISGHYVPIGLRPEHFETGIRALPKLGFRGINVTLPYKETIITMAEQVSDRASLIGAANTIMFREDGRIYADNTDGYGFLANLEQHAPSWSARSGPVLILGAGGAARAIVAAFAQAGAPEIRIANRTRNRAESLRDRFGAKVTVVDWNMAADAMAGAATIVNTTSLGMQGQPPLNLTFDQASSDALATDIVYAPLITPFLARAAEAGLMTVDGLGMLLHQAAPGFQHWFGVKPEVDDELRNAVLSA